MRRSGIEGIGKLPWGSHFCQFYSSSDEIIEILVPYFGQGLVDNEMCIWVTVDPMRTHDAAACLRTTVPDLDNRLDSGQLQIVDHTEIYLTHGCFCADRLLDAWMQKESEAIRLGFDGLRVSGPAVWADKAGWKSLCDYEAAFNEAVQDRRILALCSYRTDECSAGELARVISNHEFALVKEQSAWQMLQSRHHRKVEEALRESQKKLSTTVRELKHLNERLELRVAERTAIAEERTEQLRRLAAQLTQAEHRERKRLATFLHDHLQQLLVGAKFRLAVLGKADDPAIGMEVAEITKLISESIDASRSLTAELSPPILHEGGLEAGLSWLSRWMTDKHGLAVELEADSDVELDDEVSIILFESIRELLFNVAKHARVRSAKVTLHAVKPGVAQVTVEDRGQGFDVRSLPPFSEGEGGFGLISIRERLDMIGGRMEIESEQGRGTIVTLLSPMRESKRFPGSSSQPQVSSRPASQESSVVPPRPPGAKVRVLLADDHKVMRQGLASLLGQEEDIELVGEAADGGMAVQMARALRPHVVIMDLSMPVMDGLEATRQIRHELPEVQVVGLSMFDEADLAEQMCAAGAVAYLTKSGPAHLLVAAIRQAGQRSTQVRHRARSLV